jgi:hypothetical protein
MLNLVYFIFFVVGVFLFISSVSKIGIIINSMYDRFYGYVVDYDLQKKIRIVDHLRCLKHFFVVLSVILMIITVYANAFNITLNITSISILFICIYVIKELINFWFFKKYKLVDLYNSIKEQWENDDKVNEKHDEEVSFIRGIDDINNTCFLKICWLIIIIMWFIMF